MSRSLFVPFEEEFAAAAAAARAAAVEEFEAREPLTAGIFWLESLSWFMYRIRSGRKMYEKGVNERVGKKKVEPLGWNQPQGRGARKEPKITGTNRGKKPSLYQLPLWAIFPPSSAARMLLTPSHIKIE